jgi:phage terminase small subunit
VPNPPSTAKPLTPKQKRFVEEYLIDLNATQAAIRAGYSAKTAFAIGFENLRKPKVAVAISEAQTAQSERIEVSQDYVLTNAVEVVERCLQRAPVMVRRGKEMVQAKDGDGNHLWRFDATGVNNALTLLSKHTGGFSDRIDHTSGGKPIAGINWNVVRPEPGAEPNRIDAILAHKANGNGSG